MRMRRWTASFYCCFYLISRSVIDGLTGKGLILAKIRSNNLAC